MKALLTVLVLLISAVPAAALDQPAWVQQSLQMVIVTTPEWGSPNGTMNWYERSGEGGWQLVGGPFTVALGRAGLGWGLGLHPDDAALPEEPRKVEGDKRAPAGIFGLPLAFAYDPARTTGTAMNVLDVEPNLFCVDDTEAPQYNAMVRLQPGQSATWKSAETMQRKDGLYAFGIFVAHNQNPPVPGRGSCIFLHIEHADGSPTAGCTAMTEPTIRALINWLTPSASPVLVQLPRPAYERLHEVWKLP